MYIMPQNKMVNVYNAFLVSAEIDSCVHHVFVVGLKIKKTMF
jgi:hypothetical protein